MWLKRSYRRVTAIAMTVLIVGAPSQALAGKPATEEIRGVQIICERLSGADGTAAQLYFVALEAGEVFGELVAWLPGSDPEVDPIDLYGFPVSGTADSYAASATFDLFDASGGDGEPPVAEFEALHDEGEQPQEPVGTAQLEVALAPLGDPETVVNRYHFGNQTEHDTISVQNLSVDGTVQILNTDPIPADGCFAQAVQESLFATQPHAFVSHDSFGPYLTCVWEGPESFVYLDLLDLGRDGSFASLFMESAEGFIFGDGEAVFSRTSVAAEMMLSLGFFDGEEEQEPIEVGTASVRASFTIQRPVTTVLLSQGVREKGTVREYLLDGQLELVVNGTTQVLTLDPVSCSGGEFRTSFFANRANGPRSRSPGNDEPEGARTLLIDRTARQITAGAQPDAEIGTACLDFGEEEGEGSPDLFGRTVWYTLVGTGSTVTIDTARSDFDTVLAVYQVADGEFLEVACDDDVYDEQTDRFSFQAAVTLALEEGETYYVQVGGFDGQFGHLRLRAE